MTPLGWGGLIGLCFKMAIFSTTVMMARVLAIFHIVVGALLIIFGIADGVTSFDADAFWTGQIFFGVWIGTWVSFSNWFQPPLSLGIS